MFLRFRKSVTNTIAIKVSLIDKIFEKYDDDIEATATYQLTVMESMKIL